MKWSECLSNRVSNIIRRYRVHMKLYGFFVYHIFHDFGYIFYHCIYDYVFCMLLFNYVNCILLLLFLCRIIVMFMYSYCYICSVLFILFHSVVLCITCV